MWLGGMVKELQEPANTGVTDIGCHSQFFLDPRDLNSGQVACLAGTLLGVISPALEVEFYIQKKK